MKAELSSVQVFARNPWRLHARHVERMKEKKLFHDLARKPLAIAPIIQAKLIDVLQKLGVAPQQSDAARNSRKLFFDL